MAHGVLGYKDVLFNGHKAYKDGSKDQQDSFRKMPSPLRLKNPDHIMDHAQ
ncbi:hypothetical protein SAMN05428990_1783 [Pseudoxanthomonas sp. YR558]|nr:hypothetical protein SAMN05428990_1783 [Pseudoxanthomonas sp. YR558]